MPRGVKKIEPEPIAQEEPLPSKFEALRANYLTMKDRHNELKLLLSQHERAVSNIGVQVKIHEGEMAKLKASIDKLVYSK